MLHKIFFDENNIVNEILKDIIRKEQEDAQRNPFLQPIEAEIKRLKNIEKQIKARLEAMKQLHQWISEIFSPSKTEKPNKTGTQTKAETPTAAGREPEPDTPNLTENEQLEMLERGLQHAVGVLESTKMAYYFKTIKQLREYLAAPDKNSDAPVPERIAEFKDRLSHAVRVLGESPRAMKSKVTSELHKYLVSLLGNIA
jgi:hypothetical protein